MPARHFSAAFLLLTALMTDGLAVSEITCAAAPGFAGPVSACLLRRAYVLCTVKGASRRCRLIMLHNRTSAVPKPRVPVQYWRPITWSPVWMDQAAFASEDVVPLAERWDLELLLLHWRIFPDHHGHAIVDGLLPLWMARDLLNITCPSARPLTQKPCSRHGTAGVVFMDSLKPDLMDDRYAVFSEDGRQPLHSLDELCPQSFPMNVARRVELCRLPPTLIGNGGLGWFWKTDYRWRVRQYQRFRAFVLGRMDLEPLPAPLDAPTRIRVIRRLPKSQGATYRTHAERRIANFAQVMAALKESFPDADLKAVRLEGVGLKEQVRLSANTSVLVMIEGGAMENLFFHPAGSGVVIAFVHAWPWRHHHDLGQLGRVGRRGYTRYFDAWAGTGIHLRGVLLDARKRANTTHLVEAVRQVLCSMRRGGTEATYDRRTVIVREDRGCLARHQLCCRLQRTSPARSRAPTSEMRCERAPGFRGVWHSKGHRIDRFDFSSCLLRQAYVRCREKGDGTERCRVVLLYNGTLPTRPLRFGVPVGRHEKPPWNTIPWRPTWIHATSVGDDEWVPVAPWIKRLDLVLLHHRIARDHHGHSIVDGIIPLVTAMDLLNVTTLNNVVVFTDPQHRVPGYMDNRYDAISQHTHINSLSELCPQRSVRPGHRICPVPPVLVGNGGMAFSWGSDYRWRVQQLRRFSTFVLKRMDIDPAAFPAPLDEPIRIRVIRRLGKGRHRIEGKDYFNYYQRRLTNSVEVMAALKRAFPDADLKALHLEGTTFRQQIKLNLNASILIMVEGASMENLYFHPPGSGVVVIFAKPWPWPHHRIVPPTLTLPAFADMGIHIRGVRLQQGGINRNGHVDVPHLVEAVRQVMQSMRDTGTEATYDRHTVIVKGG